MRIRSITMVIRIILVCIGFFLNPGNLVAGELVREKITPKQAKVLDVFTYTIEYGEDLKLNLPEIGDIAPDKASLPIAEIISIETDRNKDTDYEKITNIKIRFFVEGEYTAPISWEDVGSGEIQNSEESFIIVSQLTDEDREEADVIPPLEFGKFLWYRLIIVIFALVGLGIGGYYLFLFFKNRALDAIVETPFEPPVEEWVDKKFRDLFSRDTVSKKEFAFLLTEFLKLQSTRKFGEDFNSLTDSRLLDKIYKSSTVNQKSVQDAKFFFLYSKYSPNSERMESEEARKILDQWKRNLT